MSCICRGYYSNIILKHKEKDLPNTDSCINIQYSLARPIILENGN